MEKGGFSKLLQMQARFQQKQMQEREMKIASLYEAQQARALDRVRQSPSNGVVRTAASPPSGDAVPRNPGKVRQMFEERRTKAGRDKSYPLQPIHNTDRAGRPVANGHAKVTTSSTNSGSRVTVDKKSTRHTVTSHSVKKQHHKIENIVNGSGAGDLNHNHEPDLNTMKQSVRKQNSEVLISSMDELDKPDKDNNYMLENETFPEALAPTPTPRSPEPLEPKRPPRRSPSTRKSPARTNSQPVAPPRRVTSDNTVGHSNARGAMQRTTGASKTAPPRRNPSVALAAQKQGSPKRGPSSSAGAPSSASAAEGAPCAVCGRRFAPDRLPRHQEICKKTSQKKRKPFDALKHRLEGTEAEPLINKLRKQVNNANPSSTKVNKPLNNAWRQKHEEFIQTIRAAKQVQAHLNAGGKLSDLPPPPPSENPDYVKCPHCSRRFNQAAAERHIPKCASFQFNKPKPSAPKRR